MLETLPSTTKNSYEVRQPRSGSNPRLISFSRLLRALLLLALMVFFLPCDAQVCDSMDETFCLDYTSDKLVVVFEMSWRLAVRSHDRTAVWLCFSVCVLSSCTGVSCPVCACTEARWSGGASLVDVPTSCIGLARCSSRWVVKVEKHSGEPAVALAACR